MRVNTLRVNTFFAVAVFGLALSGGSVQAGTLYVGSDCEDFGACTGFGSIDRLGVVTTNGAAVVSSAIVPLDFLLNGIADADAKLIGGTPSANPLNLLNFNGSLISTLNAPGVPNSDCCNEEMLFVPDGGGGLKLYHANWDADGFPNDGGIREIDQVTGNEISYRPLTEVVGMALVNGEIWITRWAPREVGVWDPVTGNFTVKFIVPLDLGVAGALAWDPFDDVLWVGGGNGGITPFALDGTLLGATFRPFPDVDTTIDGLAFFGEVSNVPAPGGVALLALGLVAAGMVRRQRRG